ncbi:MAG: hypothetical protein IKE74_08815 [Mogibacterium sp.]|nr:hypothetical protein [Mogibacterium sp.]
MAEKKDEELIVDIGDQTSKSDQKRESDPSDELKQQAGELLKAAGGLAGSLGKFAKKKGIELKEKIEDEEFQDRVQETIQSKVTNVTDKIDDYLGSVDTSGTVNVKGAGVDSGKQAAPDSTPEKKGSREIETNFEVVGNETVEFDTEKPQKGIVASINKAKANRKAEKERQRRVAEEKKRQEDNKRLFTILAVMALIGNGLLYNVGIKLN